VQIVERDHQRLSGRHGAQEHPHRVEEAEPRPFWIERVVGCRGEVREARADRRDESRELARAINTELFRGLSAVNPRLDNRGVKMAPFAVLVGTEMPAILVEVSCLSNAEEAELLTTDAYRARIAAALLQGIRSYSRDLDGVAKKEG